MRTHEYLKSPRKKEESVNELITRLCELTAGKTDATIEWPSCEECDTKIYAINLWWDQTEEERLKLEERQKEYAVSAEKYEREKLAELKAKYEPTS